MIVHCEDKYVSRFIVPSDSNNKNFIFDMPETWWSRPYEYEWARQFAEENDICLDAACGLSHPLKFYLHDKCKVVHACDIDERIVASTKILEDIAVTVGEETACHFPAKYLSDIKYKQANITNLPYEDKMFDKIYCISVLEHLAPLDIVKAFSELARVIKDEGLMILTFDYPSINLQLLEQVVTHSGLKFAGHVDFKLPSDAIFSDLWGRLYCFRGLLRKQ
ncbi:methyltransferase type 11 [Lucifera butyrica]|uniref:Methyltransferase type 11 n=1 Tax=Lucifera butyrica TaxID=1351585 RepID=A0A498RED8_9FIRM|nr:class I SAM-dependent methyltransferase [Lucifera butyrica]VBB09365.1 methyltransferase type 11 [Lucifera butyrica]